MEGEIALYSSKQEDQTIQRLKVGDHFGELNFVTGEKNGIFAKSLNHSALFSVSYQDFSKIIKENTKDYVQIIINFYFITIRRGFAC